MLDTFKIITTSGVVLWSRTYAAPNSSIVNDFIVDTFIEEKNGSPALRDPQSAATNPVYKKDQHSLKWTVVKELGIIFVVGLVFLPRESCNNHLRLSPSLIENHIDHPLFLVGCLSIPAPSFLG